MSQPEINDTGVIAWFVNNPVAANLLFLLIVMLGINGYNSVPRETFPEFELSTMNIIVPVNSGSLEEVESGVVQRIESELAAVEGIASLTGTATRTSGTVVVEVEDSYDFTEVREDVKQAVDRIDFPQDAERYQLQSGLADETVIQLSITGRENERDLIDTAETIKNDLLKFPDISRVDLTGVRQAEIVIQVTQDDLSRYGLSADDIARRIGNASIDRGAGQLSAPGGELNFRISEDKQTVAEIGQIVIITSAGGHVVRLREIAEIYEEFTNLPDVSRFDGQRSIGLAVKRGSVINPQVISDAVNDYLDTKSSFAEGIKVTTWGDVTEALDDRFSLIMDNLLTGLILVLVLLSIFLNFRLAFWVAVGIPISFLGTFALMDIPQIGISLNFISTFGFIIALGIVVDDAIVVGESIYVDVEDGNEGRKASINGARNVATATTFGVLTTIAGFSSLLLVGGFFGDALANISAVVCLTLIISLVESKFILPAHLSHFTKKDLQPKANILSLIRCNVDRGLQWFIKNVYLPGLKWVLSVRLTAFAIFLLMMVFTAGGLVQGVIKTSFFPDIEADGLSGAVELRAGSNADTVRAVVQELETSLVALDKELREVHGYAFIQHIGFTPITETQVSFSVTTNPAVAREFGIVRFGNEWQRRLPNNPVIDNITIRGGRQGADADFSLRLSSDSLDDLRAVTRLAITELRTINGVSAIDSSILKLQPEVAFKLTPDAEALGLTNSEVTTQIRNALNGQEVYDFQRGTEEIDVVVRLADTDTDIQTFLENLMISLDDGTNVPASLLVELEYAPSETRIERIDGVRVTDIVSDVDKGLLAPTEVVGVMQKRMEPIIANFPRVNYSFEGEANAQAESIAELVSAGILAIFGIYALLAIPLKSYFQPLIIFSVVPFSIIGAMWGHYIMGVAVSMPSFLGIIALVGIVINDSLVLITTYNNSVANGMERRLAIVHAGTKRFRPVILTSITTFAGLMPLLFETSQQAAFVVPMAIAMGFGIIVATVFTLILLPIIIYFSTDVEQMLGKVRAKYSVLVN
ncbi:MAG: efflux RND transporter permease subunit [Paracoccaceae bacterium]